MVKINEFTTKTYNFFKLRYETQREGITYDYSELNKAITKNYRKLKQKKNLEIKPIKCGKTTYIGFSEIKKYKNLSDVYYWVLCLSRTSTDKQAIVSNIKSSVSQGRKVYAETADEGPTTDTVILFDPSNGVVIIPSNRSGINEGLLIKFFRKITQKQGGNLAIITNNTTLDSLEKIDKLTEIDFSIERNLSYEKDSSRTIGQDEDIATYLNATREYGTYKSSSFDKANVVLFLRKLMKKSESDKTDIKKIRVFGENAGKAQIIDLVNNRLIYVDKQVKLDSEGKLLVENMMTSIKKAYVDNEEIIALDSK